MGITPHTQRIRILEENSGMVHVALLKPLPAPGTVFVDFWSLGNRYTLTDNGEGRITGQGSGSVNYLTGALNITLKSVPDIGSSITISHGEKSAYTNRSGQAGYRAPEFAWAMPHQGIKPGSVVVTWMSGGVLKTATDNGSGAFTGHAAGEIDYASGKIYLRPTAMIDAGGEFQTAYEYTSTRTENFNAPAIDAGGFGSLVLSEVPAPNSITLRWITTRTVSASSGTSEIVSSSGAEAANTVAVGVTTNTGGAIYANTDYVSPGGVVGFFARSAPPRVQGIYTWTVDVPSASDDSVVFGASSGTFEMLAQAGGLNTSNFDLTVDAACPNLFFTLKIKDQDGVVFAETNSVRVGPAIAQVAPAWPTTPPPPVITTREPVTPDAPVTGPSQALPRMELAGWWSDTGGRVYVKVPRTAMPGSIYADADGMGYDLPNPDSGGAVRWTPSDLAAGFKTITSVAGIDTKYYLWK